jgi:hypothetical protein
LEGSVFSWALLVKVKEQEECSTVWNPEKLRMQGSALVTASICARSMNGLLVTALTIMKKN